jgi:mannose/fructose/N-acetylgalactosamine-specific phosphotransferase system component IID
MKMAENQKKVDELALYGAFWRINNFAGNYNFERLMALGMTQVMIPIFRSLGYTGEKLRNGYKRHLVFYNTHPYFSALIMGVMVAMEEAKASDDSITTEAINDLKVAMMGPFAGVGDSFFWGTVHPIILAIAANLAVNGNFMGVVVALLIGVIAVLGTYYPFFWGYRGGIGIVEQIRTSHLLEKFVLGAKIVAMTVAGVMVASLISISTPVVLFQTEAEGSGVALQGILDSILPKALPLGLLFLVYFLLKKKMSPILVMLLLMVLTVVLKVLGWI